MSTEVAKSQVRSLVTSTAPALYVAYKSAIVAAHLMQVAEQAVERAHLIEHVTNHALPALLVPMIPVESS